MYEFQVGSLYFWLQDIDPEQFFLAPQSAVFLGKNLDPARLECGDLWYFQDARSYYVSGPETFSEAFDAEINLVALASGDAVTTRLVILAEGNLYQVVDCEGLAVAASECAKRRAKVGRFP